MKDMILFSQAPADIQYVVSLYDKHKSSHNIHIVVINVENNYKFFQSLNLDANLSFVPLVGQKRIIKYILFIFQLKNTYRKIFKKLQNAKIYYFSNNYDYVTAFFIENLYRKNTVYFVDIYKLNLIEVVSFSNRIKITIMFYLLGIRVYFSKLSYTYLYDTNYIERIEGLIDDKNIKKYTYNIDKPESIKKNLLFFESNGVINNFFKEYENNLLYIMDELCLYYNIYIKPHPRFGYSNILNSYNIKIVPDYIPAELINLTNFDIIVGIESTSIATIRHSNKISLINLFQFKYKNHKDFYIKYLSQLDTGNINYINTLKEVL